MKIKLKEMDLLSVRQLLHVGAEIPIEDIQLWKATGPPSKIPDTESCHVVKNSFKVFTVEPTGLKNLLCPTKLKDV